MGSTMAITDSTTCNNLMSRGITVFQRRCTSRSERRRPCCELHHARARYERSNLPCRCAALHGAGIRHCELCGEGVFSETLHLLPVRSGQRPPWPAHRLCNKVLREHGESHQMDRKHNPDPPRTAL